ncbi:MAG: hypothetical protein KAH22_04665 [Thiotrichaceae bacterium]|nr:hypothetical protein [Thiotrichaceae bacterium]
MNRVENKKNREEASLLLPWYITGKLSLDEVKKVESCLATSTSLRQELASEQKLSTMIRTDPDVLDLMAITTEDQRLAALLGKINKSSQQEISHNVKTRSDFSFYQVLEGIGKLFLPPSFSWASTAIAVFLLVQIVIFSSILADRTGGQYKLVTAPIENAIILEKDVQLIIQFHPEASPLDIQRILKNSHVKIFENPDGGTNYNLVLNKKQTKESWNKIMNLLSNNPSILFVGEGSGAPNF